MKLKATFQTVLFRRQAEMLEVGLRDGLTRDVAATSPTRVCGV